MLMTKGVDWLMRFKPHKLDKPQLKSCIESALHSKKRSRTDQWQVLDIEYFQRTGSAYVYLTRNGRLGVLRLSNHYTWVRDADFASVVHRWVFEPGYLIKSIRQNDVANDLAGKSVEMTFPMMALLAAIGQSIQSKNIFYLRYDELTVSHPLRRITEETLIEDVKQMLRFGLVKLNDDGSLKICSSGVVLLHNYKTVVIDRWLHDLRFRRVDDLLFHIQRYYGHHVTKKFTPPQINAKDLIEPTPKEWRNLGHRAAQAYDPYPYKLICVEKPLRRRSLYLHYYNYLNYRIANVRIGIAKTERTPIEEIGYVPNTIVPVTRSGQRLVKTIKHLQLDDLSYAYLHYEDMLWLRLIQWGAKHHSYLEQSEPNGNLVFRRWHFTKNYVETICLPVAADTIFTDLHGKGLVYFKNNKPHPTPFGKALLNDYFKFLPYTNRNWNKSLLSMSLHDILDELTKKF